MKISFIIPVYNRPDEINELLESLKKQTNTNFEVIIIEDGSTLKSDIVCAKYAKDLEIKYFEKSNSGPGDSRNYGMSKSDSEYFVILDSDCILPQDYVQNVYNELTFEYVDCFGGPDKALDSFSNIQKAINFSMTSFLTTGGIRGGSEKIEKFQPRSFNMGLSKKAFSATNGFGNIHPGEDPDLSIRLWKLGFKTKLFTSAYVYHKRRIDWNKFFIQVNKFGKARPILDSWYPEYAKITFWLPTLFLFYTLFSIVCFLFSFNLPIIILLSYFLILLLSSIWFNKSLKIGFLSLIATSIQFYGYGKGFLISFYKIKILKMEPKIAFPELFFK